MPTNKEIFQSQMNALADSINTKAGTTGKKLISELKTAVDSIETGGVTPTGKKIITDTTETDVAAYATAQVVDTNLVAGNIKNGTTILGITGSYDNQKPEQTKTAALSMASGDQVVTPDTGKVLTQVTITKPSTLTAGNIKKNVNIGGVVGTLEEGITPTGTKNITSNGTHDVTNYASAAVNVQPTLQAKSVTPTTSQQVVTPDTGNDGLSSVTVAAVTAAIDSDIVAGNIKKDVNILGVVGTYEGTDEQSVYSHINETAYGTQAGYTVTFTKAGSTTWADYDSHRQYSLDGTAWNNITLAMNGTSLENVTSIYFRVNGNDSNTGTIEWTNPTGSLYPTNYTSTWKTSGEVVLTGNMSVTFGNTINPE